MLIFDYIKNLLNFAPPHYLLHSPLGYLILYSWGNYRNNTMEA